MKSKRRRPTPLHFPSVPLAEANRRAGKHYRFVTDVLSDLEKLDEYSAIKIDLAIAGSNAPDLRAALHRAAKKAGVSLGTASDEKYLYVFRLSKRTHNGATDPRH